ncbi:MAG: hypothetical protein LC795_21480 [Acidobacteria bacterium]|nr:hypothetical protein [Acidobacteriota bacterium]
MAEPVYEPFDEDRLILLEEIYYLMRAAGGRLRETLKEEDWHVAAAVVAAVGKAAQERLSEVRAGRRAG